MFRVTIETALGRLEVICTQAQANQEITTFSGWFNDARIVSDECAFVRISVTPLASEAR